MSKARKQALKRLSKSSKWSVLEYAYEQAQGTFRPVDVSKLFQRLKFERECYVRKIKSFGTALDWHYSDALKTTIAGPSFNQDRFEHLAQARFKKYAKNQSLMSQVV